MQILSLNLLVSSNLHKNLIKLNRICISERNISQLAVRSSVYSLHFGLMFQFQFMVFVFFSPLLLLTISGFNQSAANSIHTFDYFILSFGNFAFCQLQYCWLDCCCFMARAPTVQTVRLSSCSRCCWIVRATQLNRAAIIFTCSRRHFAAFSAWHDCQKFPYPYPYSYSCRPIYLYLPLFLSLYLYLWL